VVSDEGADEVRGPASFLVVVLPVLLSLSPICVLCVTSNTHWVQISNSVIKEMTKRDPNYAWPSLSTKALRLIMVPFSANAKNISKKRPQSVSVVKHNVKRNKVFRDDDEAEEIELRNPSEDHEEEDEDDHVEYADMTPAAQRRACTEDVKQVYKNNPALLTASHPYLESHHLTDMVCLTLGNAIFAKEFKTGDRIPRPLCDRIVERAGKAAHSGPARVGNQPQPPQYAPYHPPFHPQPLGPGQPFQPPQPVSAKTNIELTEIITFISSNMIARLGAEFTPAVLALSRSDASIQTTTLTFVRLVQTGTLDVEVNSPSAVLVFFLSL